MLKMRKNPKKDKNKFKIGDDIVVQVIKEPLVEKEHE